ncbi:MAG: ATP-binding cassette domain-containing protein [bacterium]
MSIVTLNAVEQSFGAQQVLLPVSIKINSGAKIGLVGRNGVGKTTLLKIIAGLQQPSGGHVVHASELRIGFLEQDPHYPEGHTLYAEVREGIAAVDELEAELRHLEELLAELSLKDDPETQQRLLDRYARTQEKFEGRGGWQADARVGAVLLGLGVAEQDWYREAKTFSGGERNIIGLAKIFVQDPDLTLLDEPGNHLDFEGLDWLEQELRRYRGALLLVSHNRYLLDTVTNTTWELERGKIELFSGNYSFYRAEKLLRQEKAEMVAKRAERDINRLRFQIQRLKSWASVYDNPKLARTAKRFERRVEELKEDTKVTREDTRRLGLRLAGSATKGDIALDVVDYSRRHGDGGALFKHISFRIGQGNRVALVGPNGSGKTTFLRDVVREGRWESDRLRVGRAMKIGYLSQTGEELNRDNPLTDELMHLAGLRRGEAEALLYRFLFAHDDLDKPVSVLSGGERVRLQLAALMAGGSNFLLLDEPTNHLDVFSREAVEDALEDFAGTILVVSHDRYFLDKIAERVIAVKTPTIESYDGNFSEFWEAYKRLREQAAEEVVEKRRAAKETRKQKRLERFKKMKFNAERFKWLEQEIARLDQRRQRLEGEIVREREKGNRKREAAKREKLEKTRDQLELVWAEWTAMGNRKADYGL